MYLSSPLVALAMQRYPKILRPAGLAGLALMDVALVTASFTSDTAVLVVTQGVLYAIGGLAAYFPAVWVVDRLFQANKGIAFGFVLTGTGISGAVVPFVMQWMLDRYGFRTALRVWAVVLTVLVLPATLAVKDIPPASDTKASRWADFYFLKTPSFWLFQFGNVLQSLAYFLPALWIPSFAFSAGLPSESGPLTLCLLNIAACGGYLLQGYLVDRFHVTGVIIVVTLGTTISVFAIWGFATSQALLYVFALTFGLTGGGYAATWAGCAKNLRRLDTRVNTGLVIAFLCAGKGIGVVLSGPISERLLRLVLPWRQSGTAYDSQYAAIILFTGVAAALGGTAGVGRLLKLA